MTLKTSNIINSSLVVRILQKYELSYLKILESQNGYRNLSFPVLLRDKSLVNLIFYKREHGIVQKITNANRISNYLSSLGIPTRQTIDRRIMKLRHDQSLRYCALYNYLPGFTIPWEAYTQTHLRLLGKMMSDIHEALVQLPKRSLPDITEICISETHRMNHYFQDQNVQRALISKLSLSIEKRRLEQLIPLFTGCQRLNGQRPLHMDFVRSNILFDTTSSELVIAGVLDFEKTAYGHPLFDIARTLAFLLVDCKYKTEAKVRKYFLNSGYLKYGKSTIREDLVLGGHKRHALLESLIDYFLLYDLYKFLRHNPYESLPSNEHFIRTRDILCQRIVIKMPIVVAV